jgi:hypothetical protein
MAAKVALSKMGIKGRRRQRWKMLCRFLANERKQGRYIAIEKLGPIYFVKVASQQHWVELMWQKQFSNRAIKLS